MNRRFTRETLRAALFASVLALTATALGENRKPDDTPCFWQRDPEAGFDNEGRNHCAPVAISDGLIYLATARGLDDLVEGTDHDAQIALIIDLARKMATDPKDGTNPDRILTGLRSYAEKHDYEFERLELATWRGVSASNRRYKIGTKPDLKWLRSAAKDPDIVEVLNFGWYTQEDDGTYTRHSGHWVNVVGAGAGPRDFELHNPILRPDEQETDTTITLEPLDDDFVYRADDGKVTPMNGYYSADGPGLPFNKDKVSAAVLDSAIVFKLRKN